MKHEAELKAVEVAAPMVVNEVTFTPAKKLAREINRQAEALAREIKQAREHDAQERACLSYLNGIIGRRLEVEARHGTDGFEAECDCTAGRAGFITGRLVFHRGGLVTLDRGWDVPNFMVRDVPEPVDPSINP